MMASVCWSRPQVTLVSFVLGWVACLSSLVLLVLCMQARGDDFLAKVCTGLLLLLLLFLPLLLLLLLLLLTARCCLPWLTSGCR